MLQAGLSHVMKRENLDQLSRKYAKKDSMSRTSADAKQHLPNLGARPLRFGGDWKSLGIVGKRFDEVEDFRIPATSLLGAAMVGPPQSVVRYRRFELNREANGTTHFDERSESIASSRALTSAIDDVRPASASAMPR